MIASTVVMYSNLSYHFKWLWLKKQSKLSTKQFRINCLFARHCTPDTFLSHKQMLFDTRMCCWTSPIVYTLSLSFSWLLFVTDKQQIKRQDNCTKFFMHILCCKQYKRLQGTLSKYLRVMNSTYFFFHLVNLFMCDEWVSSCVIWSAV